MSGAENKLVLKEHFFFTSLFMLTWTIIRNLENCIMFVSFCVTSLLCSPIHFVRKTGGYPDGDLLNLKKKTSTVNIPIL